jgi:hypothetical protein
MLRTDRGAGVPTPLPRGWISALLIPALAVAGCGGTDGRATPQASPATCVRTASTASCLRYVERVARVRSIELTSKIPLEVKQACAATARMTRIRVICPPVVPAGGVVRIPGAEQLYGPQIVTARSYSVSINNGTNEGYVHWEFGDHSRTGNPAVGVDRAKLGSPTAEAPRRSGERTGLRRALDHHLALPKE